MKSIIKLFGGYSKMMASISQIILAVILIPPFCFLLSSLIGTSEAFEIFLNLISESSATAYWFDILVDLQNISSTDILLYSLNYINNALMEAYVIGGCVCLLNNLTVYLKFDVLKLLQSILGVLLGCIMVRVFQITNGMETVYFASMLVILNLFVIWLCPFNGFLKKVLKTIFGLFLQSLIAVLSACYIVYLTLIINGYITNLLTALYCVCIILLPLILALLVDFFIS